MSQGNQKKSAGKMPVPISGVLEQVLASTGLARKLNGWRVVEQWPQIVGEAIAMRSQAVRFSEGTLFVAVEDAAWRQEMAMRVNEILETIHQYPFGRAVRKIRLCMGQTGKQ